MGIVSTVLTVAGSSVNEKSSRPDVASLTLRVARCEHGKMLRHDPEPTAAIAATSGRPQRPIRWHPPMPGNGPLPKRTLIQVQAVKAGEHHDHWSANGQI
eukprot:scaffold66102_cov40-Phaeocystis_antarctica.AAC.2